MHAPHTLSLSLLLLLIAGPIFAVDTSFRKINAYNYILHVTILRNRRRRFSGSFDVHGIMMLHSRPRRIRCKKKGYVYIRTHENELIAKQPKNVTFQITLFTAQVERCAIFWAEYAARGANQ